MAVTSFRLPTAPKTETVEEKTKFTPIDTENLPTKEMTAKFKQLVEINAARKKIEDELEAMLLPYFDPPEGLVTVFGFRYNSIAFNYVSPRKTTGKMVLTAPVKRTK